MPSRAVQCMRGSRRGGAESRIYLAFGVAAPGVDIPGGGQGQRVLGTHGDVLDENPGQQRHLLGAVVVAGAALGQPDQPICKASTGLQGQEMLGDCTDKPHTGTESGSGQPWSWDTTGAL